MSWNGFRLVFPSACHAFHQPKELCDRKFSSIHGPEANTSKYTVNWFHIVANQKYSIKKSRLCGFPPIDGHSRMRSMLSISMHQLFSFCSDSNRIMFFASSPKRYTVHFYVEQFNILTYAMVNGYVSCINRKLVNKFLHHISKRLHCIRCGINSSQFLCSTSSFYFSFWLMDVVMITFIRVGSTCQRPM